MRKNCLPFPVELVENVFEDEKGVLAEYVRKATGSDSPRIMLVVDQNVVGQTPGLGTRIGKWVQANQMQLATGPLTIVGGEWIKNDHFESVQNCVRAMLNAKLRRDDCVVIIAGGVVQDLASYCAAQVYGGIKTIRVATTPLAMFDSVYSTRATINVRGGKSAMGIGSVPFAAIIDPSFAPTVLDGVWRAGFSSAMRYAVSRDEKLCDKLIGVADAYRNLDRNKVAEIASGILEVRRKKGESDFAFWLSNRLEEMSGFKLPHGYAIAMALQIETRYSLVRGFMTEEERLTVCDTLKRSGALDGVGQSRYLLSRGNDIVLGADTWLMTQDKGDFEYLTGIGKCGLEKKIDISAMKQAIKMVK